MLIVTSIFGGIFGALLFVIWTQTPWFQERPAKELVWQYIDERARLAELDPAFVYAIAWAESGLNPTARSSVARGMMQVSKSAWRDVSDESYRSAWNWRTNIQVGIDYLVKCRSFLESYDQFSYPLLAACYRFGPYHIQSKGFDLEAIQHPNNEIYRMLLEGNVSPVPPPVRSGGL